MFRSKQNIQNIFGMLKFKKLFFSECERNIQLSNIQKLTQFDLITQKSLFYTNFLIPG